MVMNHQCSNGAIGRMLHAYELGLLSIDEVELFETHLLECSHCADEVSAAGPSIQLLRSSSAIRRLTSHAARETQSGQATSSSLRQWLANLGTGRLRWALASALVALLAYPASYLFIRSTADPVASVQVLTLIPTRSQSIPTLRKSSGTWATLVFLYRGAQPDSIYRVRITGTEGRIVFEEPAFTGFDEFRTADLLLNLDRFDKGTYLLTVASSRGDTSAESQDFRFDVTE